MEILVGPVPMVFEAFEIRKLLLVESGAVSVEFTQERDLLLLYI